MLVVRNCSGSRLPFLIFERSLAADITKQRDKLKEKFKLNSPFEKNSPEKLKEEENTVDKNHKNIKSQFKLEEQINILEIPKKQNESQIKADKNEKIELKSSKDIQEELFTKKQTINQKENDVPQTEMKRNERISNDTEELVKSLKMNIQNNAINNVYDILDEMNSKRIQKNLPIYCDLIEFFAKNKDISHMQYMMDEMNAYNIQPTAKIYKNIINGYTITYNYEKAENIFLKMKNENIKPIDFITYKNIIECYSFENNKRKLRLLFNEMKKIGLFDPNIASIYDVIYHKQPKLIDFLLESSNQPKEIIFSEVLNLIKKQKNITRYESTMVKMLEYDVIPTTEQYDFLLANTSKYTNNTKFYNILSEMKRNNVAIPDKYFQSFLPSPTTRFFSAFGLMINIIISVFLPIEDAETLKTILLFHLVASIYVLLASLKK